LKAFDPETQRTTASMSDVWLPPAREAVLTQEIAERARARIRDLADGVNWPSIKARRLADDVADGKQFYGGEGYLPAYYPLTTLLGYLPERTVIVVEEPPSVIRAIEEELVQARAEVARRAGAPHFGVEELYCLEDEIARDLARHTTLSLHRFGVSGEQV